MVASTRDRCHRTHELAIEMMETFGLSFKFYFLDTDEQIDEFEIYLDAKVQAGSMVEAVWCECPSNPLLYTVDLKRIRKLAGRYGFVLIVEINVEIN